eukprot:275878_1
MSLSSRFCSYLWILCVLISPNTCLDCSQYTGYQSCTSAKYCSWTQLRCVCESPVNVDLLFTISTSAYIGEDHFEYAIKPWLREITEVGINADVTSVGWDIFNDNSQIPVLSSTTYNKMQTFISTIEYDAGAADLSSALERTLSVFNYSRTAAQKLNVIIMGSNPYKDTGKISEVCQYASSIKQMGIEVVFIGIGSHWKEARIDCLVSDDAHIIHIDSYDTKDMNASLPIIYDFICPIDTRIKITEVKPFSTIKDTAHARFVEFYNQGMQITSTDTLRFDGLIQGLIQGVSIAQGVYFVIYDPNDGVISCDPTSDRYQWCKNSVYIACGGATHTGCAWNYAMDQTDWNIEVLDNESESLDAVQNDSDIYWPAIPTDYSFELQYVGYNNHYGSNYVRSCTTQGTPGTRAFPCAASDLQCILTDQCTVNGDQNAFCSNSTCICNDVGFYPHQGSCYRIPAASNCIAYIVHNDTEKYTRFEFDGADTDNPTQYALRYYQKGLTDSGMVTVIDVSRVRTENDLYSDITSLTHAGYVYTQFTAVTPTQEEWTSPKWHSNCTIITQRPTLAPTASPTTPPTSSPTMTPTSAPTWQIPKVYLSGDFCIKDRCNCFGESFDCCLDDNAEDANCSNAKELSYNLDNDGVVYQSIRIVPDVFPYPTLIHWKVRKNGSRSGNDTGFGITVQPMDGTLWINDTTSSQGVALILNATDGVNQTEKDDLEMRAMFVFEVVSCWTLNAENGLTDCDVIYPSHVWMAVDRTDATGVYGGGAGKVAWWIWVVLAACAVFLVLLGLLLYRYWYKGRKQSEDYQLLTDDVEFQKEYNDEDIQARIKKGDISFNPMATGMPGSDKEHDPLTVELEKRQTIQHGDLVEQDAEKVVFKSEMGQVQGKAYAKK